ncbi:MAG TPA: PilZ domain-containing protein [Terriglobales bacterium]|nr:PilZ domain-containing protein [Terriglobales bacterium]
MPQKLLDALSVGHCSHEFSWPRRAPDGHYYQICMLCATEYKYDWTTMRRTERVEHDLAEAARNENPERKPTWVPRARRLKLAAPLRYRAKAAAAWIPGTITNLSQSGVLLAGPASLPQNSLLEMMFEMPEEISGQEKASVLCQGRVIRCKSKKAKAESKPREKDEKQASELAVAILDYRYLPRG